MDVATSRSAGVGVLLAVVLAGLMTLSNVAKPPVVDDAALFAFAHHIAQEPADPFGFEVFWYHEFEPANHVLTPPVVPYWWSLAIRFFGERVWAWKLWFFPFHLLFTLSVLGLARRFVPGRERTALILGTLAPTILPALNLMLDVPALALGLCALVTFLRSSEKGALGGSVLAGLLAGLALQTKYNALASLLALLVWGVLQRRLLHAFVAGAGATLVFVAWEAFTAWKYGQSHFLYALLYQENAKDDEKPLLLWGLGFVCLVGATLAAPAAAALARRNAKAAWSLILLVVAAVAVIPFLPAEDVAAQQGSVPDFGDPRPELFVLGPLGLVVCAALGCMLVGAWRSRDRRGIGRFLVAWIAIETLVLFALSPFLAGRRLVGLGLPVVLAALFGEARPHASRVAARGALVLGVLLGSLFAFTDLGDARARAEAAQVALRRVRQLGGDPDEQTLWYVGHWSFQYQAERLGMQPLIAGSSRLKKNDWILIAHGVDIQRAALPESKIERMGKIDVGWRWPWSTLPSYYTGPVALRAQADAQLRVELIRPTGNYKAPVPRPRGGE